MSVQHLPETMTEVVITEPGGPEVLQTRCVDLPQPAAGELLMRVQAAGINRPDVLQRMGKYPIPAGANPTPGLEVAGVVVAIGTGVVGFALGDRVCALTNGGGYAEYCLVPATQTLLVPDGISATVAAAIPETFFTVWANLFQIGAAKAGQTVLIHGGGSGIGTTALMLCREFGIKAFATAGSAAKCQAIEALGAVAINYHEQDFAEVIKAETAGRGVDVILDIIGAAYFSRNVACLALDGRLVIIGFLGGVKAREVDLSAVMSKRAVVTGSTLRSRTAHEKAAIADALREAVWPVLSAGRCLPMIHAVLPLAQAGEAHRLMESGEHIGKIVLEVERKGIA